MTGVIGRAWFAFPLQILFLVGCAAPRSVSIDPDLDSAQLRQPPLSCAFEFDGIFDPVDQRRVEGYWYSGTELEDLAAYIDAHIGSWFPDASGSDGSPKLAVALYRLSSESKSTATFFNVVLQVKTGNHEPEYLRGRYSSITWFGTPEEFQVKMQRAVNQALAELHGRLEQHCEEASA